MTETTSTPDSTPFTPAVSALSCPFCGSGFSIGTVWGGSGYTGSFEPDCIECAGPIWCGAEWETNGTLRTNAGYLEYPAVYTRPEDWVNGN